MKLRFKDGERFLQGCPVRMFKGQKSRAREFIKGYAEEKGFACEIQKSASAANVIVGDIDAAEVICTAHYDTPPKMFKGFAEHQLLFSFLYAVLCVAFATALIILFESVQIAVGVILFFNLLFMLYIFGLLGNANKHNVNDNSSGCITLMRIMDRLPEAQARRVAFVFFDNEEKGLIGSSRFNKKYGRAICGKSLINFDCVGMGDALCVYSPSASYRKEVADLMVKRGVPQGINLVKAEKPNWMKMSDNASVQIDFSCGVFVEYVRGKRHKTGIKNIHCSADKQLNEDYIDFLSDSVIEYAAELSKRRASRFAEDASPFLTGY